MISDLDVYRSALLLIRRYGADVPLHAAMRYDELLEAGDLQGTALWKRILAAIEVLQRQERPDGLKTH